MKLILGQRQFSYVSVWRLKCEPECVMCFCCMTAQQKNKESLIKNFNFRCKYVKYVCLEWRGLNVHHVGLKSSRWFSVSSAGCWCFASVRRLGWLAGWQLTVNICLDTSWRWGRSAWVSSPAWTWCCFTDCSEQMSSTTHTAPAGSTRGSQCCSSPGAKTTPVVQFSTSGHNLSVVQEP